VAEYVQRLFTFGVDMWVYGTTIVRYRIDICNMGRKCLVYETGSYKLKEFINLTKPDYLVSKHQVAVF
jgi:hypothetical protein